MKVKSYPIQIWFLDDDIKLSAQYLTNKTLNKSIMGCVQALVCSRFYFIGIRNEKFYDYYFSKERVSETMDRFFPMWPIQKKPSFQTYNSKFSKWCRQCKEHYDYIKEYLRILLDEYEFRLNKNHGLSKFLEWEFISAPKLNIPEAHLKKIYLPWKNLNPKYRRRNIIDGYRLQFMNSFENDDAFLAYMSSNRDIPQFVIDYFKLNID